MRGDETDTTSYANDAARHRPGLSKSEAAAIVREHYGLEGTWAALPSDRDQNFRLTTRSGAGYVVKIAQALEERDVLEAQHAALDHLSARGMSVQQVVASNTGRRLTEISGTNGIAHFLRILTFVDGIPMADVRPHSPGLIRSVGAYLGRLDATLSRFDHPGAHRNHSWDLTRADRTLSEYGRRLESAYEQHVVDHFSGAYSDIVAPRLDALRRSCIHNDANDHNVLVNGPAATEREVVGLIDFGDFLHSITVAEPAVAAAYAAMDKPDPLGTAAGLIGAYHQHHALREDELAVLYPLIGLRLCVSICMSAHQGRLEPDNEYLFVSREPAMRLLRAWTEIHPRYAEYVFRHACGMEPCPASLSVATWLRDHASTIAPVVERGDVEPMVFDFSVGSTEWSYGELTKPGLAAAEIARRMEAEGAAVGIGRYDEVRLVYRGEQFATPTDRRTVHLGLDLFQPAGSVVRAPLDGVVHSFADNERPYDYGPTVILEHNPPDGPTFYTLYGHLSRSSLSAMRRGRQIARGEPLGQIGDVEENGSWAPHLHFQIIADLLGREGDFPGVAAPSFRDVWLSISPDPRLLVATPDEARAPRDRSPDALIRERNRHVGPSLRVSYRRPVTVRRGYMQYLFDADGGRFLDTVNNVAHVGHSHPRVVEAVARTLRVLNTNTRYLYRELGTYAERLCATLPDPLGVCYFVNSGSEANDLALRMAKAHTGRHDVVVVDHAYHGNLASLIEISPYKFNGPGGLGRPTHTHVVPMPDPLRGPTGTNAARCAADIIRLNAESIAGFVAESAMSCGGQVFYPDGYLREMYNAVHAAGAVTIADEVQTGFGRVGQAFWAFELQGVVPDIVTLGKPIGNGHPLGAVVTTREIARSFDNGMEYFNTFGGNPVACSAGLAVLDVLHDEELQQNAQTVGEYFLRQLGALMKKHAIIGDVRGSGLFIGIELTRSREDADPAGEEANYVVERMRDQKILTSVDGPYHNVIKIKPPLVIQSGDVDSYVRALDDVLQEDFARARLS